ncbi:hypothetical protein JCM3765_005503 [Sporobolomyces pararoseus]
MTETITVQSWTHSLPPFPTSLNLVSTLLPLESPPLGPNDLLIEIYSAGLNPVDVQLSNLSIFKLPSLGSIPRGLGKDFSGKLLAKGSNVGGEFQIGDEIFGVTMNPLGGPLSGTLSTISILDFSRSLIIKKPPLLSHSQAASLPLSFLTGKTCLSKPYFSLPTPQLSSSSSSTTTRGRGGMIVILGGSTSVGIQIIQYSKLKFPSLKIISTGSTRNLKFLKSLGVDEVIDYTREESVLNHLKQFREEEGEGGFISIIDCVGGLNELLSTGEWKHLISTTGSYVSIVGDKTDKNRLGGFFTNFWNWKQCLRSLQKYNPYQWFGFGRGGGGGPKYYCIDFDMTKKEWLEELKEIFQDEEDGKKERGMKIFIEQEFEFDKVGKAFEKLVQGKSVGKIVVNIKK